MMTSVLTIGELARLSGLSTHTIRFYETEGLLSPINRAANGHRRYRAEDVAWLEFVLRLKKTGMPLAQIREYAQLRAEGERTLSSRLAMLQQHRQYLDQQLNELTVYANALDEKIRWYQRTMSEQQNHSVRPAIRLTREKNEHPREKQNNE